MIPWFWRLESEMYLTGLKSRCWRSYVLLVTVSSSSQGPPTSLGPWPPSCNARLNSSMLSRLWVSPFWLLLPLTRTLLIALGSSDSPGKVNARDHVNKYCGAYMCHFNLVKLFSAHEMFSKHLYLVWVCFTVLWRKVYRLYTITEMES